MPRARCRWLNNSLKKKGYPQLNQLEEEFTDGVNLMHIVNALYDLPVNEPVTLCPSPFVAHASLCVR